MPFITFIILIVITRLISDAITGPETICGKYIQCSENSSRSRNTSSSWIEIELDENQTYDIDKNTENTDFLKKLEVGDEICMKYYPSLVRGFDLVKTEK